MRATVALAIFAVSSAQATAGTLYVLGQAATGAGSNVITSFGTIDTVTGTYTQLVSNVLSGTLVQNLAWSPSLGRFYTTSGFNQTNATLRTISTSGSVSAAIGAVGALGGNPAALWFSGGVLSMYARNNNTWGTVNTTTGVYTSVNNTTADAGFGNFIGGRGAVAGSAGYMLSPKSTASSSGFGTVNLTTGVWNQLGTNAAFQTMVIAGDGNTLYGIQPLTTGSAALYTINTSNGSLTKVADVKPSSGNLPVQFSAAAVPEPSAIALGVTALAMACGARMWRGRRS